MAGGRTIFFLSTPLQKVARPRRFVRLVAVTAPLIVFHYAGFVDGERGGRPAGNQVAGGADDGAVTIVQDQKFAEFVAMGVMAGGTLYSASRSELDLRRQSLRIGQFRLDRIGKGDGVIGGEVVFAVVHESHLCASPNCGSLGQNIPAGQSTNRNGAIVTAEAESRGAGWLGADDGGHCGRFVHPVVFLVGKIPVPERSFAIRMVRGMAEDAEPWFARTVDRVPRLTGCRKIVGAEVESGKICALSGGEQEQRYGKNNAGEQRYV